LFAVDLGIDSRGLVRGDADFDRFGKEAPARQQLVAAVWTQAMGVGRVQIARPGLHPPRCP